MNSDTILGILKELESGGISAEAAFSKLRVLPYEDLGYANVDHHRAMSQGAPEVILGASKTPERLYGIVRSMKNAGTRDILITRITPQGYEAIKDDFNVEYHAEAKLAVVDHSRGIKPEGLVIVAGGGTGDIPVCEEAAVTAEVHGSRVTRMYDVGVAGIHRLLSRLDEFTKARAVVAVAGMEGALASVIGGLVSCPVIAVPTSVGYGANFGGLSALLAMLNSCAAGVSVVNIDNGFGAGYLADMINKAGKAQYEDSVS